MQPLPTFGPPRQQGLCSHFAHSWALGTLCNLSFLIGFHASVWPLELGPKTPTLYHAVWSGATTLSCYSRTLHLPSTLPIYVYVL